jgi:hypothetical protein
MNIMDLVNEYLIAHPACVFGRCTVEFNPAQIEIRTREHDFILQIKFGSKLTAAVGYYSNNRDGGRYHYDYPDDMENYYPIPTFDLVGHRFFRDPEDPEFLDHVGSTLMEFLDSHEEWSTRRVKQEVRRAASQIGRDEDK